MLSTKGFVCFYSRVAERYNTEREYYIENPERHPSYQDEWMKFWDRRCGELEAEGKDTENYDFHKEWMQVWLKRMQEIMHEKVENEVYVLKICLSSTAVKLLEIQVVLFSSIQ